MDTEFIRGTSVMMAVNLIYAVVGLFVGVVALRLVDLILLKKINLEEEIQKGNVAAAIFAASLVVFIGFVMGMALAK